MKPCSSCERRWRGNVRGVKGGCQVFLRRPRKECWAWTDDIFWLEKVQREVAIYSGHITKGR